MTVEEPAESKFIILSLFLAFLLNGCGISSTSEKYDELSSQYEYYQESIKNIQKYMEVDPAQANDIFLTLVDCGISNTINYIFKNNDGSFDVWFSGKEYSVVLENCIISSVFTNGFPESVQIDELQQFYLDFDSSFSYVEAAEYISNIGLLYSEVKYNGSRVFQIAFTDGCTAQKYKKESGPYIVVNYDYAKDENSNIDDFEKYSFSLCQYIPESYFSYAEYKESTCINRLGSKLEEYTIPAALLL